MALQGNAKGRAKKGGGEIRGWQKKEDGRVLPEQGTASWSNFLVTWIRFGRLQRHH